MGAQDDVHDMVAAKIAAHHAAILADLSKPRRRKSSVAGKKRARTKPSIVGEQLLFGTKDNRVESYGETRTARMLLQSEPRRPLPMVRQREIRCTDCDYRLVVRSAKVICPKCGEVFGDAPTLRALRSAFGSFDFIDESEPA